MAFFSQLRRFLRWHGEFDDRLGVLERQGAAQKLELADLNEFTHRLSRKRYQEDYKPAAQPERGIPYPEAPTNNSKETLRALYRKKMGIPDVDKLRESAS